MGLLKALIERRSVLIYYALAFAISWGGILLAVGGPGGIPGTPEKFEKLMPLAVPAMLGGPVVAGLLMTALVGGKRGFRDLFSRLVRFRSRPRSLDAGLFFAPPLLMISLPFVLSLFRPEYVPRLFLGGDTAALLRLGIVAGLGAGLFEEIGWTGFVIPRLRQRHSILSTGLIVGFFWGGWHLLVNVWSSGDAAGELSWPLFLHSFLFSAGILPAFRVLMVWAYDRTESLMLAMLWHMSLTTSNVLFVPRTIAGATGIVWSLIVAAALWIIVGAAVSAGRMKPAPPS
jgi:membrane protease YdiL (CAAX protease family)